MPTHPLRDLAWQVDALLQNPEGRERFIDQINLHIDELYSQTPRGQLSWCSAPDYEIQSSQQQLASKPAALGWLSARDDENVFIHESYAILAALRECVYKGRDRLELCDYGAISVEMEEAFGCKPVQKLWELLIRTVNDELTEEHRSHVESWLRDVRLDLDKALTKSIDHAVQHVSASPEQNAPENPCQLIPQPISNPVAPDEQQQSAIALDGPEDGCRVRFEGKSVKVKGRTYAIILFMWNRQAVSFDSLKNAATSDVDDKTVHTWMNRANNALAPLHLPWKLTADSVNRFVRKQPR